MDARLAAAGDAAAPPTDCSALLRRTLGEALDALSQRHGADMAAWRWGSEHIAPLEAQALTMACAPAAAPNWMLTRPAAPLGISIGTVNGLTRCQPFSRKVS